MLALTICAFDIRHGNVAAINLVLIILTQRWASYIIATDFFYCFKNSIKSVKVGTWVESIVFSYSFIVLRSNLPAITCTNKSSQWSVGLFKAFSALVCFRMPSNICLIILPFSLFIAGKSKIALMWFCWLLISYCRNALSISSTRN